MALVFELITALLLIFPLVQADGECPEVRCLVKLASAAESLCTSHSGPLTYIKPCSDPNTVCDESSGICQTSSAMTESLPGELCTPSCFGTCEGGVCMGWSELDYCDYQLTCHVGLRCVEHTCVPLLKQGEEGCKSKDDCSNGLMCLEGICVQMYSLPAGSQVKCFGDFAKHDACDSGMCSNNSCLPIPEKHTAAPEICTKDTDCDTNYAGIALKGACQCTISSFQPLKICTPRVTDLQYKDRLALLKEWTTSSEIQHCHRFNSMSFACMRRVWETSKTERLLELMVESRFQLSFHLIEPCLETHYLARARSEILYFD